MDLKDNKKVYKRQTSVRRFLPDREKVYSSHRYDRISLLDNECRYRDLNRPAYKDPVWLDLVSRLFSAESGDAGWLTGHSFSQNHSGLSFCIIKSGKNGSPLFCETWLIRISHLSCFWKSVLDFNARLTHLMSYFGSVLICQAKKE